MSGYAKYIEELSLLDDLINSQRFHSLFSEIAEYLIYAGALPGQKHHKLRNELTPEEYDKFIVWVNDSGLVIESKKKVCDMHLQNACDELKAVYKEVLERDGGGF